MRPSESLVLQVLEFRKLREEEVRVVMETWPWCKILISYKYDHARGASLSNIDYEIDKAIREELPK